MTNNGAPLKSEVMREHLSDIILGLEEDLVFWRGVAEEKGRDGANARSRVEMTERALEAMNKLGESL